MNGVPTIDELTLDQLERVKNDLEKKYDYYRIRARHDESLYSCIKLIGLKDCLIKVYKKLGISG